jgi:tRNA U38,U39,U40 pseudouridine synthase TruA
MATVFSRAHNLCDIDQLGEIKAQIADLTAVADKLAASIKDLGAGSHDGDLFTATVSVVDDRFSTDAKAVEAKLRELMGEKAFASFAQAHQKKTSGYTALKLAARKS